MNTQDLILSLNWMPPCSCGSHATHEQYWSDRGPLYYCDDQKCGHDALKAFVDDGAGDRHGLLRQEVFWAKTARLLNVPDNQ